MRYGFIGCGNMGGSIASAVAKATTELMLCDPSSSAEALAAELGCATGTNDRAAALCDRLFLAVKPQVLRCVLEPLVQTLRQRKPLLVTMAAGIKIETIEEAVGAPIPIVRIMPNTPVTIGKGTVLYCRNAHVSDEALDGLMQDMRFCGALEAIPEPLMDAASALLGCGPAFGYMFIEALAEGACSCGVPAEDAVRYAALTVAGAAEMVLQSGKQPDTLRQAVCSPGGSTLAGIGVLREQDFCRTVADCVRASYRRTLELGK